MAWLAIIHICFTSFPHHQLISTISISPFLKPTYSHKFSLTKPGWGDHSCPLHLWNELVPYHLTLVNIVLGFLSQSWVLYRDSLKLRCFMPQPNAIMNPCVDLKSQLERGKQRKNRIKSRGILQFGMWFAGSRPPPKVSTMWLLAVRLTADLASGMSLQM